MTGVRTGAGLPRIAASIVVGGGALVLVGWAAGLESLTQPMATATAMKPVTAGALMTIGAAIWLHTLPRFRRITAGLGGLVAAVALFSLVELFFGQDFRMDRTWLASSDPIGRLSPLTAIDLTVLGLSLAVATRPSRAWLSQTLALFATLVATIVGIGYLYRLIHLIGVGGYTTMAPHTALLMLVACGGVLFLYPADGVMAVFASDTLGGRMARRILPATILVPIGLGWLRLEGERAGLYDPRVGPPIIIVGTMILLSIVVWFNARTIARVDAKRQLVEEDLRRSHESLEARVAAKTAELAQSRAAAAESAETFFQLFEFAPDALIAVNEEGEIDRTNIRALSLFGYERSELIGQPVEILISDRLTARHAGHRTAFLQAPHGKLMGLPHDVLGIRRDGTEFPAEILLSPAGSPHGRLVLAVVRDLTERRQTQALTRAAEERLQTAQRMEALGELAGGVAHDFNNMMTVVNGYSELLLARTADDHPFRSSLQQIKKAGDRCAGLTGQLLAFSRRQVLTPSNLDLGSMVVDLNQMMTVLLGETIAVSITSEPDLWPVRADQAQIEQVLVNLVVNARDAMPAGGTLSIQLRNRVIDAASGASPEMSSGEYVTVTVTDNGQGMDEGTRTRAFEPFFTTKPVGQGSGLGLSTAYGFIQQSGGFISLNSERGRGTTVEVSLPRADSMSLVASVPRQRSMPGGQEGVLLAEDEPAVRTFLRHVLTEAGYSLLEASDGHSALEIASAHAGTIHLLISDVVMPVMNGSDLADRLRRDRPHVRVLLISGHAQHRIVEDALTKPGTGYLRKPFTADELLTRVREILDAPDTP